MPRVMRRFRLLAVSLVIVLAACATKPAGQRDLLDFIKEGTTLRQDAHVKLGEPSAQYESGRIHAYRLGKGMSGYYVIAPAKGWDGVRYSLILVFDHNGVLSRHSLVEVRAP